MNFPTSCIFYNKRVTYGRTLFTIKFRLLPSTRISTFHLPFLPPPSHYSSDDPSLHPFLHHLHALLLSALIPCILHLTLPPIPCLLPHSLLPAISCSPAVRSSLQTIRIFLRTRAKYAIRIGHADGKHGYERYTFMYSVMSFSLQN